MSSEEPRQFEKSGRLNVTVGPADEQSDEELVLDPVRNAAPNEGQFDGTQFVEDTVVLPSSPGSDRERPSTSGLARRIDEPKPTIAIEAFPLIPYDFAEEVYAEAEKKHKILNGYIFGEVLGDGAYSKVKECINSKTMELCSIKISKDRKLQKIPGGFRNAKTEVRLLSLLNHPNIVRFVDHFVIPVKHKQYLVLERCLCSIQQMLDVQPKKRLPEIQCRGYFRQLIKGLEYLHSVGIIHKDIKPGNLLVNATHVIKICDMGVSEEFLNILEDDWCTVAPGTAKFQPPEAVNSTIERFRGRPIDIWSSGVTLYNMVSGEYPYEGDTVLALYDNIENLEVTWPNIDLGDDLHTLLSHMLEKDPEYRWDTAAVKNSAWFCTENNMLVNPVVTPMTARQYKMIKNRNRDVGKTVQWNLDEVSEAVDQLHEERAALRQQAEQYRTSRFGRLRRFICPWGSEVNE